MSDPLIRALAARCSTELSQEVRQLLHHPTAVTALQGMQEALSAEERQGLLYGVRGLVRALGRRWRWTAEQAHARWEAVLAGPGPSVQTQSAQAGLTEAVVKSTDLDGSLDGTSWLTKNGGGVGGPATVYTARKAGRLVIEVLSAYGVLAAGKAWRIDVYSIGPGDSNWANAALVTSASCAVGGQIITTEAFAVERGTSLAVASIGDVDCGCIDARAFALEVP